MHRFHRLALASLAAAALLAPAIGGCSSSTSYDSGTPGFIVTYSLAVTGLVTFDSLKYDDGTGVLVRATSPENGWFVVKGVVRGGSVQALAGGIGTAGATVMLKANWVMSGVSSQTDSVRLAFSAPGHFNMSVAKRIL